MKVLYIDTIGFIQDVPETLIEPFVATLEDAMIAVSIFTNIKTKPLYLSNSIVTIDRTLLYTCTMRVIRIKEHK